MSSARVDDNLILNSLTAVVAIVDNAGVIVTVNDAWRRFAQENHADPALIEGVGLNYLETCRRATVDPAAIGAGECLRGMLAVLQGAQAEFELEYPCHAPDQERWFQLRALPLRNTTGLIVAHFNITERKRMEQSLQESREQVRLLLDSTAEAIYGLDITGRCTFCNPAALRLLRYDNDQRLLGKPMHALIHHSYADGAPYPLEQCRIHRTLTQGDYVHRDDEVLWRADGDCFPVEYWSYPVRKGDDMVGAVVTFIDISERRRILQALQQERDRAQHYLDLVEVIVVSLDRSGAIQSINRKGCQTLGWREQQLLGKDWFQTCLPERIRPTIRQGFDSLIAGRTSNLEYFENPVLTRNGQERLIAWHNVRLTAADGAVTGTLSSGEDITERRRAEEALTASEARFRMIADTMPSILVGVDLTGHVTEWNQEAERVTGVPAAAARGKAVSELLPQYPALRNRLAETARRRRPAPVERIVTERQGEFHYADVVIYPLLVGADAVGAVIRIDDLTARVQLEQMLLQTEKMLSVGGLAAGMAHELNNPLGVILQGGQNILRRLSPDLPRNQRLAAALGAPLAQVHAYLEQSRILSFLENMAGAARRAARIVADMQSFTERGHANFELVRLEDMLDTAAQWLDSDRHLKQQCDLRQVTVVRDYADAEPVRCNRVAIEQVLLNLLKNAAQAMTGGGRPGPHRLTLRTRQEDSGVRVEVEDNGPGIDAKTRRRLFEPFFTTKPAGVGAGLGLSVSYFIVHQQHGGVISVRSTPGKGACFIIRLPAQPKPR